MQTNEANYHTLGRTVPGERDSHGMLWIVARPLPDVRVQFVAPTVQCGRIPLLKLLFGNFRLLGLI